ncbi:MAG: FecR family protein [Bacillota bacterium]|nr:FecR family protein [Bacillota bacterium]
MNKKRYKILMASLVVVLAGAAVIFGIAGRDEGSVEQVAAKSDESKTETYRSVEVLETVGTAEVTRKKKDMAVYESMKLQPRDLMSTGEDSQVDLKLDDDKYVVAGESTKVRFIAKGNKEKGSIRLKLKEGELSNVIENKLSEEDSYEVETPDCVMAVRGTEFYVMAGKLADGKGTRTVLSVQEGSVEVQLKTADGLGETRMISAGERVEIHTLEGEAENAFFVEPSEVTGGWLGGSNTSGTRTQIPTPATFVARDASIAEIMSGTGTLERGGQTINLTKGLEILQGDRIRLTSGTIEIQIDDNKKIFLEGDGAELLFSGLSGTKGNGAIALSLPSGSIACSMSEAMGSSDSCQIAIPGGTVAVQTPSGNTGFGITVEAMGGNNETTITVDSGQLEVALTSNEKKTLTTEGEAAAKVVWNAATGKYEFGN